MCQPEVPFLPLRLAEIEFGVSRPGRAPNRENRFRQENFDRLSKTFLKVTLNRLGKSFPTDPARPRGSTGA